MSRSRPISSPTRSRTDRYSADELSSNSRSISSRLKPLSCRICKLGSLHRNDLSTYLRKEKVSPQCPDNAKDHEDQERAITYVGDHDRGDLSDRKIGYPAVRTQQDIIGSLVNETYLHDVDKPIPFPRMSRGSVSATMTQLAAPQVQPYVQVYQNTFGYPCPTSNSIEPT